jgi:hypothetical protein
VLDETFDNYSATQEYAANVIAESLYSQVDEEGREFPIMEEISDRKKDTSRSLKTTDTWRSKDPTGRDDAD